MPKLIYQDSTGVERSVVLATEPMVVGRSAECQVQTQDAMVSRRHARIFWDGGYYIEDLGSSNGVYVGQDKVQKAPFRPGDIVTCGSLVIRMVPDMRLPTSALAAASLSESHPSADRTPPPAPPMPSAAAGLGSSTMAVPAMSAPSMPSPPSPSASVLQSSFGTTGSELSRERDRREQAENALLSAAKKSEEYEGKIDKLKTHIEQLTAEVRREKRAGEDAVSQERNARAMVEGERDQLRRRLSEMESQAPAFAQTASMGAAEVKELDDLRFEVDRLRRQSMEQKTPPPQTELESQVSHLRSQLQRAEMDRDAALRQASQAKPSPSTSAPDPAAADAAIALGDALVELRSSLRAATDEAALLTAPRDSAQLVTDALQSATENLEQARSQLRVIGKVFGVS